VPARGAARLATTARGPRYPGIRFAPEMIASPQANMPHISFYVAKPMTAYLISLALVGLVAIAV
jgi:hypothetical protein